MRLFLFALTLMACSGSTNNGTTAGTNGATTGGTNGSTTGGTNGSTTGGTTGSSTGGTTGGNPPAPFTVSIGPFSLASADEIVKCAVVKIPTTVDTDVVNIQTTLLPGSHHLILYRTTATAEKAPYDCSSFEGVFNGDAPVFIAESAASEMQLPTGVAYHFTAGQFVLLEAHYINTTPATISAKGTVTLTPGGSGTYQAADIMMCGSYQALQCNLGGGIPAGRADYALPVGFYNGNGFPTGGKVDLTKLKFFAFTSHEHHRGIDVKIWKSSSSNISSATQIYDNTSWDNPPLTVLPDNQLLTFGAGEGFAWQCHYDSTADSQQVCFGESANAEMCFIWAYYYPSVGRFIAGQDCWAN
jgi:Copper type II ascorbate-dependent monooxygenase, C-terminal domain